MNVVEIALQLTIAQMAQGAATVAADLFIENLESIVDRLAEKAYPALDDDAIKAEAERLVLGSARDLLLPSRLHSHFRK